MDRSVLLSLSLRSRQFPDQTLLLSLSLCSRHFLDHSFFYFDPKWPSIIVVRSLSLKIFEFWFQMIANAPNLGSDDLGCPRKPLFLNHGTKSFILVYNLSRFENVCILTPNDPKYPQLTPTPNLQNKISLSVSRLQFELSQALIGQLCNELFEKQA